jgi:hypothetical protein
VDIATLIVGAVAAVAAVGAVVVSVRGNRVTRDTLAVAKEDRDLSKDNLTVSKEDRDLSQRASDAADLDRQRRALTEMGDVIEAIARSTGLARPLGFTGKEWQHDAILLRHLVVGREQTFPNCQALAYATSFGDAGSKVQMARSEVEIALRNLSDTT